uniref:BTB domain-containing protein n=1 Tax=Panagrolaimus davidi TaxID=227884 RepID=A0A914QAI8_9BILA
MLSSAALTEVVTIKKLLKWTINDFNKLDASNMKHDIEKVSRRHSRSIYIVQSPTLTAFDPYNGTQYTATFKLTFYGIHGNFSVGSDVLPWHGPDSYHCYFNINDDSADMPCKETPWNNQIKKLTIFLDVKGNRSFYVSPFKKANPNNLGNRLKEILEDDSDYKFTIKCGENSFATFKPFLAANSFFFRDMFKSTTQNLTMVEITDFKSEVVQKMVEFCECHNIKDVNGFEDELFKISHKLQIPDLMEFAVEKMSQNANTSNILAFIQIAIDYKLKDFEEWCMQFAFRTKVNVK